MTSNGRRTVRSSSNPFAGEGPPNPFDNDSGMPPVAPKRGIATPVRPSPNVPLDPFEARRSRGVTNPFEFDAEFKNKDSDDPPLLTGMDSDDQAPPPPMSSAPLPRKSNGLLRTSVNPTNIAGWLRGKDKADEAVLQILQSDSVGTDEETPEKRKKQIAQWPFDSYHVTQQVYYEKVDSLHANDTETSRMVTRPRDLPDIPTAVQNLSLVDFERKAEERAIGIISTWIYDEGLMEELVMVSHSNDDGVSVQSSEGVEIGPHGYPLLEGSQKIDKEIQKFRDSTSRELALINARLNDGVAASGSEVQELVNAVTATKGDLGKLRELSTYISKEGFEADHALLADYPKLKAAINARRNLAKCFRELDFFSQIPATCSRLRDEVHNSEWQEHEWRTLREVCKEHVELEVFLIEAEAGMKARIDDDDAGEAAYYRHANPGRNSGSKARRSGARSSSFRIGGNSYDSVDRFLDEHAKDVRALGEELKFRVLSGVGTTFDLALKDPAGMVALVEAVEFYEAAAKEYTTTHLDFRPSTDPRRQLRLQFTEMRRAALEQICEDFEDRGKQVFKEIQQMAANEAGEDDDTAAFNAVLRASNNLTNQMDFVHHQMAPCFPKFWAVEALWTSVVAHVCSQNLFQQIGGRDAKKLPDLTVTQLLDLVAWIENFYEKIEEAFPDISIKQTRSNISNFEAGSLLHADKKEIDVERAKESVALTASVMLEVKGLAQGEFITRTKEQTQQWLVNVYHAEHAKTQTEEGKLTTSLCEDVYSLAGVQLRTIRERLTKKSEVLVLAVGIIFSSLAWQQTQDRDRFLKDLETCCAAANDFVRMSEQCEEILSELEQATSLSKQSIEDMYEQSNKLLTLYSNDAVYAAQRVHEFVFEPIEAEVGEALFNEEWEERLTHNELAVTIVRTLEDYMNDLEVWLEDIMVRKVVDALVIATINFYLKRLLLKAEKKSVKDSSFKDPRLAFQRIKGDIKVFQDYFTTLVETFPALQRVLDNEFAVMILVREMLAVAGGILNVTSKEPIELVWEFQKRIKDKDLTRKTVGNLWHLMNPKDEYMIYDIVEKEQQTLDDMAPDGQSLVDSRTDRGLRLDLVILDTLGGIVRKRPTKVGALASMEKMVGKWSTGDNDDDKEV